LQVLLNDLVAYKQDFMTRLERADQKKFERTITALVLKGCFLKLATEKQFLLVDNPQMFANLIKLRRRKPKPTNQVDMWRADRVNVAVDHLLEDLELDSTIIQRARLGTLYNMIWGYRLEILGDDLLGNIYQGLNSTDARKAAGQYYTPPALVTRMLDTLDLDPLTNKELTVLDPSCGSGQFLLGVYDKLKEILLASGMDRESAHRQILETHLYGFDIDPFALVLTKMNLFLRERITDPIIFNIYHVNPLKRDELELCAECSEVNSMTGRFDVIVGNPPWGSKLTAAQKQEFKKTFESASSGVNSFTLFIERAVELLKVGGKSALLIPEAYINIKAHRASRKLLLRECKIDSIVTCGEQFEGVFAPAMLLFFSRENDIFRKQQHQVSLIRNMDAPNQSKGEILQAEWESTPENIFNVHLDVPMLRLMSKIANDAAYLKGHANFGLGIVTGDNERLVADSIQTEKHEPLIVGKDISKYRINFSGHYIVYDRDELQQACPRDIFDAPQKLVYRFINKQLTFACDEMGRFTLNNANVFVPRLPGFRIKYLLALLNSSVLQFYYTFNFFTVKVLRGNLERLPLRWSSEARQIAIESMIDRLANCEDHEAEAIISAIDQEVFAIYNMTEEDERLIGEKLSAELGISFTPPPARFFGENSVNL